MREKVEKLLIKEFKRIGKMSTIERNSLLCNLCVKRITNPLTTFEHCQIEMIQMIRTANGEIAAVLKSWEENPELDPRK